MNQFVIEISYSSPQRSTPESPAFKSSTKSVIVSISQSSLISLIPETILNKTPDLPDTPNTPNTTPDMLAPLEDSMSPTPPLTTTPRINPFWDRGDILSVSDLYALNSSAIRLLSVDSIPLSDTLPDFHLAEQTVWGNI
jgi:hypothetical protein